MTDKLKQLEKRTGLTAEDALRKIALQDNAVWREIRATGPFKHIPGIQEALEFMKAVHPANDEDENEEHFDRRVLRGFYRHYGTILAALYLADQLDEGKEDDR